MGIVAQLARFVPPAVLNKVGRLEYSNPYLRPLIRWASRPLRSGESVIRFGLGKGLRFDPSGGNPGYALGSISMAEQNALAAHLRPAHVFYDVGANVGFFAVLGAKLVGPAGRVYAFEPFPQSVNAIRANAQRNGFANTITVVECAVSSQSGEAMLSVDGDSGSFHLAGRGEAGQPVGSYAVVPVFAIDDLVVAGRVGPPNVVLIDVEGSEIAVLEGMRQTLAAHRPVILCEVHGPGREFSRCCANLLGPLGYTCTQLNGSALPEDACRYHAVMVPGRPPE